MSTIEAASKATTSVATVVRREPALSRDSMRVLTFFHEFRELIKPLLLPLLLPRSRSLSTADLNAKQSF
jgi:hypothetical protein